MNIVLKYWESWEITCSFTNWSDGDVYEDIFFLNFGSLGYRFTFSNEKKINSWLL